MSSILENSRELVSRLRTSTTLRKHYDVTMSSDDVAKNTQIAFMSK